MPIDVSTALVSVATREGGVDRNALDVVQFLLDGGSPPARVAWIETSLYRHFATCLVVATREGGVDRNIFRHGLY